MAQSLGASIRPLALRDAQLWTTRINPDAGLAQILYEFVPVRAWQLLV